MFTLVAAVAVIKIDLLGEAAIRTTATAEA